jgi:1,4-dihydroxy-2-naphthoyl-CoA synthase
MAEKIATKAPLAITMTKAAVNAVSAISFGDITYSDSDLLQLCAGSEDICAGSEDIKEGMMAYFEKRKPDFTGG